MRQGAIAERLVLIEERLTAIETSLTNRSAPASNVQAALRDIEESYGLTGQLVEVAHAQREQIEALIHRLDRLTTDLEAHDGRLTTHDAASQEERTRLCDLMVQLRELARMQVRGQADLARAIGDGWDGVERRRTSIPDRG